MVSRGPESRAQARLAGGLVIWFAFCIISTEVTSYSAIRYALYLTPAIVPLIALFVRARVVVSARGALAAGALLTPIAVSALISATLDDHYLRNVTIIATGALGLLYAPQIRAKHLQYILVTLAVGTVLSYVAGTQRFLTDPSTSASMSVGLLENSYGLSTGFLVIAIAAIGTNGWAMVAVGLDVLMFKRSAIVFSVLLGPLYRLAASYSFAPLRSRAVFAVIVGTTALVGLHLNEALAAIVHYLGVDLDLNQISLGRFQYNAMLEVKLEERTLSQWIFGYGPGAADRFIYQYFPPDLPHNDFLKILVDYGYLGLVGLLVAFLILGATGELARRLIVFDCIILLSDNTLIYPFHWFVLAMALAAATQHELAKADERLNSGQSVPRVSVAE